MTIPHTKFWISLLALGMAFTALLIGRLDGAEFVTITGLVAGIYGAANVGATVAHLSAGRDERVSSAGQPGRTSGGNVARGEVADR